MKQLALNSITLHLEMLGAQKQFHNYVASPRSSEQPYWEGCNPVGKAECPALLNINMGSMALDRLLHLLDPLFLALSYEKTYVSSLLLAPSVKWVHRSFMAALYPSSKETLSENNPTTYPLYPALPQVPDPR